MQRVERLVEEIRLFGYQGKHRKSLAHSRDELFESEIVDERIQGRDRRVRDQSGRGLPERGLDKEKEAVELRTE